MRQLSALLLLLLCSACPPFPPPEPAPPKACETGANCGMYGLELCPLNMTVTFADVCDGLFTSDGLACAHCAGAEQCFDKIDYLYCARGPAGCLGDTACYYVDDGQAGKPKASRKKAKKIPHKLKAPS